MMLHYDCRFFRNDIPCVWHKSSGVCCVDCSYYDPISTRILVVKLDAIGDVLRTTFILPGLRRRYPNSHITWVTRQNAEALFKNNPYVDRVLSVEDTLTSVFLQQECFDVVINPDASPRSAVIAQMAKTDQRFGFVYDAKGYVQAVDEPAQLWLEMGCHDGLKSQNTRSYQDIIASICKLDRYDDPIMIYLSEEEKKTREVFQQNHHLHDYSPVIGLNTGSSPRWPLKAWSSASYKALISLIQDNFPNARVVLFGGPHEFAKNSALAKQFPKTVIDSGCDNDLRTFFALLSVTDLVVTGDTLGLHASLALGKRVVCLVGPTSKAELFLYDQGDALSSDLDCLCCYNSCCDVVPNCMDSILPDQVLQCIKTSLV